jgi:D-methionine transport system permease protein
MSTSILFNLLFTGLWQTLYMVLVSGIVGSLIGIPLGMLLFSVNHPYLLNKPHAYHLLSILVNIGRSIPFIILLVAVIPFTRFVVGTTIGTTAAIVPLTIGAIPFIARLMENALREVNPGLIEAGLVMGASNIQIFRHILWPEALPNMISGLTVTAIALVSYSAMAGAIGGGGLGDIAIRYGYQRFDTFIMLLTVLILVVMVEIIQRLGDYLSARYRR